MVLASISRPFYSFQMAQTWVAQVFPESIDNKSNIEMCTNLSIYQIVNNRILWDIFHLSLLFIILRTLRFGELITLLKRRNTRGARMQDLFNISSFEAIQECHVTYHVKSGCLEQLKHHQGPSYRSGCSTSVLSYSKV